MREQSTTCLQNQFVHQLFLNNCIDPLEYTYSQAQLRVYRKYIWNTIITLENNLGYKYLYHRIYL
jgi:hypothetical protein